MAGLGLGLLLQGETAQSNNQHHRSPGKRNNPQILNKTLGPSRPFNPGPPASSSFLQACSLCNKRLSHKEDIYMYRGDGAFCSEECRGRQIFMDEEEKSSCNEKCSLSATSPSPPGAAEHGGPVVGKRSGGGGGAAAAAAAAATGGLFAC